MAIEICDILEKSYTPFQTVEYVENVLKAEGFSELNEQDHWKLKANGKYYVKRNDSSIIAFRYVEKSGFLIAASHTDSPCFKLKESPVLKNDVFFRLNVEEYGGTINYTFFDRPLKLAGRVVRERDGVLVSEGYVSDFTVVIPSLAIHMNRDVNKNFAPNLQTDLAPLLGMSEQDLCARLGNPISYDLFLAPAEKPFVNGADGELLSSPRLDNMTSVCASINALLAAKNPSHTVVAACFDSEEIGSRTRQGAGGNLLKSVLKRIAAAQGKGEDSYLQALSASFLLSLDNAHSVHPNHPELCDPTNRAVMGGGVVIKAHAGGAYTTDAFSSAIVKKIFSGANVKYQTFYNRSDLKSGKTLGALSLEDVSVSAADIGIAQLAMHSAVETMKLSDYAEMERGVCAFFQSDVRIEGNRVEIK